MTMKIGTEHYRLNHRMIERLQQGHWTFAGLRLTHGMLHAIAVRWGNATDVAPFILKQQTYVASTLRGRIGLVGQNDNRLLHRAVKDIRGHVASKNNAYEGLEFLPDSRVITVKFSDNMASAVQVRQGNIIDGKPTKAGAFGYFDVRTMAQCRTLHDLMLYGQVGLT